MVILVKGNFCEEDTVKQYPFLLENSGRTVRDPWTFPHDFCEGNRKL